jgi:hypothetical protein
VTCAINDDVTDELLQAGSPVNCSGVVFLIPVNAWCDGVVCRRHLKLLVMVKCCLLPSRSHLSKYGGVRILSLCVSCADSLCVSPRNQTTAKCDVSVLGVTDLELRVTVVESSSNVHAVWVDPVLTVCCVV